VLFQGRHQFHREALEHAVGWSDLCACAVSPTGAESHRQQQSTSASGSKENNTLLDRRKRNQKNEQEHSSHEKERNKTERVAHAKRKPPVAQSDNRY
jgi:hypothetical protein